MAQQSIPNSATNKFIEYGLLYGVDYSRDVTDVDRKRSPEMVNMISDLGGNPIKRDGYRALSGKYDGIVYVEGEIYGAKRLTSVVQIYKISLDDGEFTETLKDTVSYACTTINEVLSFRQYMYILTDKYIVRYCPSTGQKIVQGVLDGTMSASAIGSSDPTFNSDEIIPTVAIALQPDGTGGASYYGKNLLSIYQRVTYLSDKTVVYKKDENGNDKEHIPANIDKITGSKEYIIPSYVKVGSWIRVEVRSSETGEWETVSNYSTTTPTTLQGKTLDGSGFVSCSVTDAKITFDDIPPEPVITGQDNIRITYAPFSMEEVETNKYRGYFNQRFLNLLNSKVSFIYNQRMVIADGSRTYYSNTAEPLLMDDNMWFEVDNPVMCYSRVNSTLGVITKDIGANTIYLASEETKTIDTNTSEIETYFVVKPSNAGVGAISSKCNGSLNDEPIFLSSTGVYGLLSNYTSEKYAVNRTSRINRRLCKEDNLDEAVGIAFNSYFYICVNSHMYVIDGRHRDSSRNGESSYECYYFDGMPDIKEMYVLDNRMFFSDDTYLYTWNIDYPDSTRYKDYKTPTATGTPVCAKWCSALDDDNYPHLVKTLQKKGSVVTLAPFSNTGAELTLCKDGEEYVYVGSYSASLLSFDRVPFANFSFKSEGQTADAFMKKKSKKYRRLQIILENNNPEPFGITSVTKVYQIGDLAKARPSFSKK